MGLRRLVAMICALTVSCTGPSDGRDVVERPESSTVDVFSGDDIEDPTGDEDGDQAAASDSNCDDLDSARLVREQSIPGGHRLHLRVVDADGDATPLAVTSACLTVTDDRQGVLERAVSSAPPTGGATLIVARWAPEDVESSRNAIDELLVTLPPGERIAVWAWSQELVQVTGATTDRELVERRLDAVWTADDDVPLDPATAADIASEEWEDFADDVLLGPRSVIFVAPTLDLGDRPDIDRDVVVDHWIVRSGDGGRVVELGDAGGSVEVAADLGERLARESVVQLTVVDVCDDGGSLDVTLSVDERTVRDFGVGDAAVEHVGANCALDRIEEGPAASLAAVEVMFDEGQRIDFDQAVVIAEQLSGRDRFDGDVDPEWDGSISFDGGVSVAPFDASFRGQSSIECSRRNWSIDLDGGDARHPIVGSGTDEFTLASMCNDEGYVNTLIGSAVMAEFGVWSQATGAAEFRVDGVSQGVYLVIEDPDVDLRGETSRVVAVLRRRYDVIGVLPDVEYIADPTSNDDATVLSVYDELVAVASTTSGEQMIDELRARFDLDQYLRWSAVMSLLGSGDHIDELYLVGSESVNEQHDPIVWFAVNGWDPDDLYAPCHRAGRFAIDDPTGLLSCTESLLDSELFADPVLYDLYADVLAAVAAELTPERFAEIATFSASEVTRHLDDPEVVNAMVELVDVDPNATTPGDAVEAVEAAAVDLIEQFSARRNELLESLDELSR